ncbi:potassium voltage-gated channel subfamily H member 3 isoform X4 [Diceros bicornis minor]|uniref:potassium voltage-gated channel subfamily H member 3 isoform X4 n=1 Tax=Diceros bicornis minor TaxID=77932 RepID=UPI0026EF59A7|nr:potassium voltage-gated channel subfamily H member 3 isoform X4 [Diceros bicornis minor]
MVTPVQAAGAGGREEGCSFSPTDGGSWGHPAPSGARAGADPQPRREPPPPRAEDSNFVLGNAQVAGLFPVVYCSDGFCDLTGFSRAEVMQRGCACSFLYGPDTSELVRQQIRKALDEHKEFKAELILYRKSGLPFWCLLDVIPIKNEKGEVALFLVSHKDISDTKNRGGPDNWKERGGGRRRYGRAGSKGFNANRRRSRAVLYHLSGHLQKQPKGKHKLNKGVFGEKPNLPEYKVAAIRKSPFILLHCGALRATWDGFILLATLYVAVTVPYSVCVSTAREPSSARSPPSVCDLAVEVLFILDIVLNFRTTFVSKSGQVVFAPKSICLHYVTTWFLLDVIAALPFDLLHAFKVNVYVGAHLLKTVRLLRLLRLLPRLDRYSQYSAVVLTLLMAVFALLAHWVACIWFYIGQREIESSASELPEIASPAWASATCPPTRTQRRFSPSAPCSSAGPKEHRPGPAEPPRLQDSSRTAACVPCLGVGGGQMCPARCQARPGQSWSRTRDLRDYIRIHRIPKPLKQRMLEYFQATWAVNNGIDTTELLQSLPDELRADIAMHLHKEVLQLPLFEAASRGCLRALSLALRPAFCTPGEYLIHQGDALQALYFVCSGSMEVLKGGTVLAILGKGDLIGCELPRREQVVKANADVKGLTYCVLQCLQLAGLHESLALYPEFAPRFSRGLRGELSYNLGAGGGTAEADTSSLSGDNTLMSTLEEKETDGEQGPTASPAPADELSSPLLSPGCTSSSSAAKLLSPRQTAPRPRLGGRGRLGRAGASQAEVGPSARPRSIEGLRLPPVPWNVPPDLSPRVVDGIEDGCGSDQPKFSFRVQSGPECSSSPSPGPENGLLTVPLGPSEARNTDTLDKLRQAVMELSEQVLQMREGLQSLRQALQLVLAPHGEGPCPRASGEGPCPASTSGLLQPLCVDTGASSYCLQPPAGSVLSGTWPHPRPGPPPLTAPWPWGPPASQSSPWPRATAFWTSTSDSEPPGSGELCPEPSTPGSPPPEEGARTGPLEPVNQAEATSTGEPPPGSGGLALPWDPHSLEMVLIGCHGSGTVQWTQEEGTGV